MGNALCWILAIRSESLDEARAACDASLRVRPNHAPTLDSRGMVGLKQGRFQDAWNDYDAAVRSTPAARAGSMGAALLRSGSAAPQRGARTSRGPRRWTRASPNFMPISASGLRLMALAGLAALAACDRAQVATARCESLERRPPPRHHRRLHRADRIAAHRRRRARLGLWQARQSLQRPARLCPCPSGL